MNLHVGQRVVVIDNQRGYADKYHGQTGTVAKVNPKNSKVRLDNGANLTCYNGFLFPEGTEVPKAPALQTFALALPWGTTVAYTGYDPKGALTGVLVVVGDQGGKTRVCHLNGNGTYWRVPNDKLRKVDVEVTVKTEVPA